MSTRRELTDQEHQLVKIWLKNINVNNLETKFRNMVLSIGEQYERDGKLSDNQIAVLQRSKFISDVANRNNHVRQYGSLDKTDISKRLDAIYNPVRR